MSQVLTFCAFRVGILFYISGATEPAQRLDQCMPFGKVGKTRSTGIFGGTAQNRHFARSVHSPIEIRAIHVLPG